MTSAPSEVLQTEHLPRLTAAERDFRLSPEEAQFMHDHIRVRLVGTVHGNTTHSDPEIRKLTAPSDLEYSGVKGEVNQLDPANGDVLFVEEAGHANKVMRLFRRRMTRKPRHEMEWEADDIRALKIYPTVHYGAWQAFAHDVPVVVADIDGDRYKPFLEARLRETGIRDEQDLLEHGGGFGTLTDDLHDLREHLAAFTVIEHALANMPEIIRSGKKALYEVVWGDGHFDKQDDTKRKEHSLPQAFRKMGVEPEVVVLPSDLKERMEKIRYHLSRKAASKVLDDIFASIDAAK